MSDGNSDPVSIENTHNAGQMLSWPGGPFVIPKDQATSAYNGNDNRKRRLYASLCLGGTIVLLLFAAVVTIIMVFAIGKLRYVVSEVFCDVICENSSHAWCKISKWSYWYHMKV